MLYVSGFMSTELAGTCAVLLYIYRHQRDWTRKSLEMMALNHHPKMGPSSVHLLADHHMYPHGKLLKAIPTPFSFIQRKGVLT